tara:strand:- start:164 stop:946 length:783 start_codon:yes stop_codon:yes gene_type:complete
MQTSSTVIKLVSEPSSKSTKWSPPPTSTESDSSSSSSPAISCAECYASNNSNIDQFIVADSSSWDPSTVVSLCPYATSLSSLKLMQCSLNSLSLSPLLIAPLGKQSLLSLTLGLSLTPTSPSRRLDGLFTTISSCCQSLESLSVYRDDPNPPTNVSAMNNWKVEFTNFELLASSCLHLIRITLEKITVLNERPSETKFEKLEGLVLLRSTFNVHFFKMLCAGGDLKYVELIRGTDDFNFEEGGEEDHVDIENVLDILANR